MPKATDRNVYILGAGFSASAGAPLINNFLDRSREYLDNPFSGLDDVERQHFEDVFEFRRTVAQAREKIRIDLDNIEQLFGLVEISQQLGKTKREIWLSTVYLIAKTLQLSTVSPGRRPSLAFNVKPEQWERALLINEMT